MDDLPEAALKTKEAFFAAAALRPSHGRISCTELPSCITDGSQL
jgi:hypothetical protein